MDSICPLAVSQANNMAVIDGGSSSFSKAIAVAIVTVNGDVVTAGDTRVR